MNNNEINRGRILHAPRKITERLLPALPRGEIVLVMTLTISATAHAQDTAPRDHRAVALLTSFLRVFPFVGERLKWAIAI